MDKNNMKIIKKAFEFPSGDRDMSSKYVDCPTCRHYVFKSNGRRIKSVNTI